MGQRTVAAVLWTMRGVARGHRSTYHRVFSRAVWSLWPLGRILATAILHHVLPDQPVLVPMDKEMEVINPSHVMKQFTTPDSPDAASVLVKVRERYHRFSGPAFKAYARLQGALHRAQARPGITERSPWAKDQLSVAVPRVSLRRNIIRNGASVDLSFAEVAQKARREAESQD